ncbi:MAG: HipA domain-containing protein [Propionibacteriaceae bacterium]|jgi:serine/threonine-protein kinase HipA|nr:HipA domain-containing protein [Propionibacteriaceae bacterium]
MANPPDLLDLHFHGARVARIRRTRDRRRVELSWDDPLDLRGVVVTEGFAVGPGVTPSAEAVSNWLGGYAPEGNQRQAMADARGIAPDDLFGLLREFGGSVAGAVSIRAPGEPESARPRHQPIESRVIGRRLRQAVERGDLGIQDDSRSMVPGFQPKLLLARLNGRWREPRGRAHSTHILKPRLDSRPQAVHNELYSLTLAARLGLAGGGAEISRFGDQTALVLPRFDRTVDGEHVGLIHQEDFAQALSLNWLDAESKFQDPRSPRRLDRPSAYRIAEMLGSLPRSGDILPAWLRQFVFRLLIGDNDAHAKNFALVHDAETRLADVYDAVPNLYQEDRVSYDLALAVDGEFDWRRVTAKRIRGEAASWGLMTDRDVAAIVGDTVSSFASAVAEVAPPRGSTPGLRKHLLSNAQRLG